MFNLKNGPKNIQPTSSCLCSNHRQTVNFFQTKNTPIFANSFLKSDRRPDLFAAVSGVTGRALRLLVLFYQASFSFFLGGNCRYYPSCSHYAREAFLKHGPGYASWLVLKRLASCQPFSRKNFYDPVPLNSAEIEMSLYEQSK